jgi:hypothetical protein
VGDTKKESVVFREESMSNEIFHGNLLDRLKKEGIEEAMEFERQEVA